MEQYHDLLNRVLQEGREKADRTGTGTLSVFGHQMQFDLSKGFPLVTTKKLHLRSIIHELLWFLSGDTNTQYLKDNGVSIWDEWADEDGDLGPVYGKQWRAWSSVRGETYDQISGLIDDLRNNPFSRRHIVTAWNPAELDKMALSPCHCLFQFDVAPMTLQERVDYFLGRGALRVMPRKSQQALSELFDAQDVPKYRLSCQLYQRSADTFLGVPFNIASYALLTHMVAQQVGMVPGDFVWTGGDVHLYLNHVEQAQAQLLRAPTKLPTLGIKRKPETIFDYKFEDFEILGYDPHPAIKAPVAV